MHRWLPILWRQQRATLHYGYAVGGDAEAHDIADCQGNETHPPLLRDEFRARNCHRVMIGLVCATVVAQAAAQSPELVFRDACATGVRATVAAVGDLLFNATLQQQALQTGGAYRQFWKPLEPFLASADVVYGNLEGTVANGITFDGELVRDVGRSARSRVFGAPPSMLSFNYHPSLLDDLRATGFRVLSTANNHALDRGWLGIDRTIDNIQKLELASTGTRKRHHVDATWSAIVSAGSLRIAWLACTYGTNGQPDFHRQVLGCYQDREVVLTEIQRLAELDGIDAVMFTPHWGVEGTQYVLLDQIDLAHNAFAAGATAILGSHPHVLQRWEKLTADDGREGLVIFSLGNFISDLRERAQRTGAVARLELLKEPGARTARVTAAGYLPTYVEIGRVHRVVELKNEGEALPLPRGNRIRLESPYTFPRDCDLRPPAN